LFHTPSDHRSTGRHVFPKVPKFAFHFIHAFLLLIAVFRLSLSDTHRQPHLPPPNAGPSPTAYNAQYSNSLAGDAYQYHEQSAQAVHATTAGQPTIGQQLPNQPPPPNSAYFVNNSTGSPSYPYSQPPTSPASNLHYTQTTSPQLPGQQYEPSKPVPNHVPNPSVPTSYYTQPPHVQPSQPQVNYGQNQQPAHLPPQQQQQYTQGYNNVQPPNPNAYAQPNTYGQPNPPVDQLAQNMSGMTLNRGFNQMFGYEGLNLLSERHIKSRVKPVRSASGEQSIIRSTLSKVPESAAILQKSRLPFGLVFHPFRDQEIPIIQERTIVRCRSCRTYINPYVRLLEQRRWQCNFCHRLNDCKYYLQFFFKLTTDM
jgi:protein transport protein SEC24